MVVVQCRIAQNDMYPGRIYLGTEGPLLIDYRILIDTAGSMMHAHAVFFVKEGGGVHFAQFILAGPFGVLEGFFFKRDLSLLVSCHADLAGAPRPICWKPVRDNSLFQSGKFFSNLPLTVRIVIRED